MNWKLIIAGATSGFLSAFVVDLNAWSKYNGSKFNWNLAFKRWVAGAVTGAIAATGLSATGAIGQ